MKCRDLCYTCAFGHVHYLFSISLTKLCNVQPLLSPLYPLHHLFVCFFLGGGGGLFVLFSGKPLLSLHEREEKLFRFCGEGQSINILEKSEVLVCFLLFV